MTSQEKEDLVQQIKTRMDEHGIYVTELATEIRRNRWTVHHWLKPENMNEKRFNTLTAGIDRILQREAL